MSGSVSVTDTEPFEHFNVLTKSYEISTAVDWNSRDCAENEERDVQSARN